MQVSLSSSLEEYVAALHLRCLVFVLNQQIFFTVRRISGGGLKGETSRPMKRKVALLALHDAGSSYEKGNTNNIREPSAPFKGFHECEPTSGVQAHLARVKCKMYKSRHMSEGNVANMIMNRQRHTRVSRSFINSHAKQEFSNMTLQVRAWDVILSTLVQIVASKAGHSLFVNFTSGTVCVVMHILSNRQQVTPTTQHFGYFEIRNLHFSKGVSKQTTLI